MNIKTFRSTVSRLLEEHPNLTVKINEHRENNCVTLQTNKASLSLVIHSLAEANSKLIEIRLSAFFSFAEALND